MHVHDTVETLHTGKYITLCKKGNYEFVKRNDNTSAVLIIPFLHDGETLKIQVIKQKRPTFEQPLLEFPAGLVEGHSVIETAIKELEEETQWRLSEQRGIRVISNYSPSSAGITTERITIVTIDLKYCTKIPLDDPTLKKDSDFDRIEVLPLMTVDEILDYAYSDSVVLTSRLAMFLALRNINL